MTYYDFLIGDCGCSDHPLAAYCSAECADADPQFIGNLRPSGTSVPPDNHCHGCDRSLVDDLWAQPVELEPDVSDNVTQFPKEPPAKLLIGPFEEYRVVVDGKVIPRLTGHYDGDKISLVLDGRFAHSFSKEDAYSAAWLIANALAIGEGYSHLGAASKERPFAPQATGRRSVGHSLTSGGGK